MRYMFRATVTALVLSGMAGVAQAQTPVKIAYVNTQALMEAAPGRAAIEAKLNKEGEGYRAQVNKMQDSINTLIAKYQKDEPTLSAAVKAERQQQIQSMETDFQAQQLKFQQAFSQRSTEAMAPIVDLVKKVLNDIRAEDGYSLILSNDPETTTIVAADRNLDITDRVVSRLRATPAAAVKAAEPTQSAAAKKPAANGPPAPAGVTRRPPPR